jgi:FtsH-binding integral membrane protein
MVVTLGLWAGVFGLIGISDRWYERAVNLLFQFPVISGAVCVIAVLVVTDLTVIDHCLSNVLSFRSEVCHETDWKP